jgi:hypothetical protein
VVSPQTSEGTECARGYGQLDSVSLDLRGWRNQPDIRRPGTLIFESARSPEGCRLISKLTIKMRRLGESSMQASRFIIHTAGADSEQLHAIPDSSFVRLSCTLTHLYQIRVPQLHISQYCQHDSNKL